MGSWMLADKTLADISLTISRSTIECRERALDARTVRCANESWERLPKAESVAVVFALTIVSRVSVGVIRPKRPIGELHRLLRE